MSIRTDLAVDISESVNGDKEGIEESEENIGEIKITSIKICSEKGEKIFSKPQGEYITIEFPPIEKMADFDDLKKAITDSLKKLIPSGWKSIMIIGLGNTEITPDSIGPLSSEGIIATRHISQQFAESIGLKGLKSVSVMAPGVLGNTGIEVMEVASGAVSHVKPDVIITIDALASKSVSRLFRTVQICNTGISPGSGVKNARKELSEKTLGVPVIALGVPTVVDAYTLAYELTGKEPEKDIKMIVTPKDTDLLCERISKIISQALNVFLQPEIDSDIILSLV